MDTRRMRPTAKGPRRASFGLRRRRRDERGAALVEAAIIFVPLCIIVFGIIEFGFIFKDSLTLSSATRAGARIGSAETQIGTDTANPANLSNNTFAKDTVLSTIKAASAANFMRNEDQIWVYKADPTTGAAPASCNYNSGTYFANGGANCIVFTFRGNGTGTGPLAGTGWAVQGGSWNPQTQMACLGGTIDSVGVRMQLHHKSITGFFDPILPKNDANSMVLVETTVMRLEPLTTGTAC